MCMEKKEEKKQNFSSQITEPQMKSEFSFAHWLLTLKEFTKNVVIHCDFIKKEEEKQTVFFASPCDIFFLKYNE